MNKKRNSDLEALLDEILTDAHGDEEQLWALRQALEDSVRVPGSASIAGEPVEVVKFDYDGNPRRGLTATCRKPDGSKYTVSAADIVLEETANQIYIEAYRHWIGIPRPAAASRPRKKSDQPASPAAEVTDNIDAAVLSVSVRAARVRILGTGEEITLRSGRLWDIVPGEIATIKPSKRWTYSGSQYLSGTIESSRLDAKVLGLTPLRLEPCGEWDPAEEYWGEPGDPIEPWARKIIKRGPRPQFEMEQVLPGADPDDWSPSADPINQANDRMGAGDPSGSLEILMGLCRADLRCLDAHAHLGNMLFDTMPKDAIRHYEAGVRIGELSLPAGFDGVLPWGLLDNRPFLRCLHGYGLCLWRLERFDEGAAVFDRMLWLNPSDNQGVRFVAEEVRARRKWRPGE